MFVDVTTTSVGRKLIEETYAFFFEHVRFSGKFRFHVTIDPAYGVPEEEIAEVMRYLDGLRAHPAVESVDVTRFTHAVGLESALMVLLSQCYEDYAINLEDDWRFFADVDLDVLIGDLRASNASMIAFSSTHLQNRGTFLPEVGVEEQCIRGRTYYHLVSPNWASDYIPLAPNVHDNRVWKTTYIIGLAEDGNRERCPEERTKEYVRLHGLQERCRVLWTEQVVVEDTGRQWLAEHGCSKRIVPDTAEDATFLPEDVCADKGFTRSLALYKRAIRVIPGQTQTYMKRASGRLGKRPIYADKGIGCYMIDVDGNCYIDYVAGLGVLQLGYCHSSAKEAVLAHLSKGVYFSLPAWHEIEAAELLCSVVPNAEMARFLKSGGDVCSAALTLSRAVTGRQDVLSCGYHGWHEQFNPAQPGALNDLAGHFQGFDIHRDSVPAILSAAPERFACVMIALPYDRVVPRETLLEIRRACDKYGVLLVLDDIVTGFRLALGGAQEYYSFDADIILLSKALTSGAELAAVCGKRCYMETFASLFVSTTMGGEMTALQAMINAVSIYRNTDLIARTHRLGRRLREGVNALSREILGRDLIGGYAPMPWLSSGDPERDALLVEKLLAHSIYMREGVNFVTGAHTEQTVEKTISAFRQVLQEGF